MWHMFKARSCPLGARRPEPRGAAASEQACGQASPVLLSPPDTGGRRMWSLEDPARGRAWVALRVSSCTPRTCPPCAPRLSCDPQSVARMHASRAHARCVSCTRDRSSTCTLGRAPAWAAGGWLATSAPAAGLRARASHRHRQLRAHPRGQAPLCQIALGALLPTLADASVCVQTPARCPLQVSAIEDLECAYESRVFGASVRKCESAANVGRCGSCC